MPTGITTMISRLQRFLPAFLIALRAAPVLPAEPRIIAPRAGAVSQPVPVNEVQSAAFWIHPTDPARSLLLITNEKRGLEVHDPGGLLLKHLNDGCRPVYVDVLYEVPGEGGALDLALASCMNPLDPGVKVWRIDAEARKLIDLTGSAALRVFDGQAPIGLCAYHSRRDGKCYFFVTLRGGPVEQYELTLDLHGRPTATRVRAFRLETEVKSCIADDETGSLYVAEDDVGVWRFDAEPDSPARGKCVIRANDNGLYPNVKGPAIYHAADGKGYLLVVSQGPKGGHTQVNVYERKGDHAFVLTIQPEAEPHGKIDHCSGLAVTNAPTVPLFPEGVLAINDQFNPNASEDFKLYSWGQIARQGGLVIDTTWSPRRHRRPEP